MMAPEILRPSEAARMLTVSLRTLYRLVEEGRIGHIRVSERGLRFRREQLAEYLEANTHEAKEASLG
jgi:excisionase family DNA binding protein